jgi:phosphatidylserine/phosphatidylglycerophosphate/cardiolipin synthase-like enzyme
MPKKKKSQSSRSQLIRNSTLSSIIFLLLFLFFELSSHISGREESKLPSFDHPIELYSNQTDDNLTTLYQDAIGKAQQSITFIIYALTDPSIIESLNERCKAGVPVYIVCDAKASPGISRRLPDATIVKRFGKGLMHQKILIVDSRQVVLGTANMTTSSLITHGNLVLGIEHPAIAFALEERAKSMDDEGAFTPLLHKETSAGEQDLELWVLPDDPAAVSRMIELLRSAQKTIKVAMFTWTRPDFTQELIKAAQRGVHVEAVVDRYSGKGASAKIVKMLEEAGIPVYLSTGQGLLHHKFAYIDEKILINGSANWTHAAFNSNDDYFVVVSPLTSDQCTKMNKLCQTILKNSQKPKK